MSDKFSQMFYSGIAENNTNSFSENNHFIIIYIISIAAIVFIFHLHEKKKELKNKIKTLIEDIENRKKEINGTEPKTKEQIMHEIAEVEARSNFLKEKIHKRDNKIVLITILSAFVIILLFTNYATSFAISQTNLKFKNDLIKIAPYIEENKIKLLQSNWARIKNRSDYEKIITEISIIKNKNGIGDISEKN